MPVAALYVDLHLAASSSLKDKRTVVRHILDVSRRRFGVAASEVEYQDLRQRAELAFAAVSSDVAQVETILDKLERFVWSNPEVEVLSCERRWLDD